MNKNTIDSVKNDIIKIHLIDAVKAYGMKNIPEMAGTLLKMQSIIFDMIDPAELELDLVDFLTDDAMWEWMLSIVKKEGNISKYDLEAAEVVYHSINDILNQLIS